MGPVFAIVSMSWNHRGWQGFITDEHDPCITNSGYQYVKQMTRAGEWWNFNLNPNFPNHHSGRIFAYAPFRSQKGVESYIKQGGQGDGVVFFISKDLHQGGRKIVGVYGGAVFHGVELIKLPDKNRKICDMDWEPSKATPGTVPIDEWGRSILFKGPYHPPLELINISHEDDLEIPPSKSPCRVTPIISGEIEISTLFPNYLDAEEYLGKEFLRERRRALHFPVLIDEEKGKRILQAAIALHKEYKDAKGKLSNLLEKVASFGVTPEKWLLELLEKGIPMGKFDAVKVQREAWDDLTSK